VNKPDADTDVVIVGAGPVGLTVALLLARYGIASIVVDSRSSASVEGSKAICIQRDSLDICARVGIADDMVAQGVTWSTGRTYYQDAELFHIELASEPTAAFPPFVNISQAHTEALLVAKASAHHLIELRYGTGVTDITQNDNDPSDPVTVELSDGSQLHATFVVGCDGARSVVRKAIGARFDGMSFDEQFLIADIRCDLGFGNERRFYFDPSWNPGRQVLVHPCPDGVWRIDWQVPADYDAEAEQTTGGLDRRIRHIVGNRPYELVWMSVYRFHQRRASTFLSGHVLLCGDSSHIYAPFGARGLNAGFHDAENAAWKIAATLLGWGGPALLASFASEREAAADENLAVTGDTMRFLVPDSDAAHTHRLAILNGARTDPALRAQVNSGRLAEPHWYNESPLTTGGSVEGFPTAPGHARPVVPGVLCPDLPISTEPYRLRSLFGPEFVVIANAINDEPLTRPAANIPVRYYRTSELDPSRAVAERLNLAPGHAAVIRPDGYLAANVPLEGTGEAVRRAAGWYPG
jgi:3-(3-hydroxy-phenyl)propionate hydroxylase